MFVFAALGVALATLVLEGCSKVAKRNVDKGDVKAKGDEYQSPRLDPMEKYNAMPKFSGGMKLLL